MAPWRVKSAAHGPSSDIRRGRGGGLHSLPLGGYMFTYGIDEGSLSHFDFLKGGEG